MLDLKNYFFNILIKVGLKKRSEKVGIKMRDSTNIKMDGVYISGADKAIDAKRVEDVNMNNIKID